MLNARGQLRRIHGVIVVQGLTALATLTHCTLGINPQSFELGCRNLQIELPTGKGF